MRDDPALLLALAALLSAHRRRPSAETLAALAAALAVLDAGRRG